MSDKLKIGVLGCADIAKRYLLPSIKLNKHFSLVGVASRYRKKADEFAEEFKTRPFYAYEDLLSADIDVIYIPLPNALHFEWINKALDKNIHVLVEKSLASNLKEVQFLVNKATKLNLSLFENFQFRFHRQLDFIMKKVSSNEIGAIRLLKSSFGFPPFKDKKNIRYQQNLGGGSLLDAGAYPLKISQIFLGSSLYVDSARLFISEEHDVDVWGSAYLKQEKGSLCSQISFGFDNFYQNNLEIWGNKGYIKASRIFTAGPEIEPTVCIENQAGSYSFKIPKDNHFINMLNYFYTLIGNSKKNKIEYRNNLLQARLVGEIFEKA